jgi:hypothetical protein
MRRLLLILVLLCSLPSWATWTKTNQGVSTYTGTGTTAKSAAAFSSALNNPSLIVVRCLALVPFSTSGSTTVFAVPTDTAGNTYVDIQVGLTGFDTTQQTIETFYALNTHTTASNVVTCHSNAGSLTFFSTIAAEFTGGATSGPIDTKFYNNEQTSGASGSNALVLGAQSQWPPTVNGDLIVAVFGNGNDGGLSAGTSPNAFTQISNSAGEFEYFVQTTAAAIQPTAGDTNSSDLWGGMWVAFTPSGTSAKPTNQFRNDVCTQADGTLLSNNWILKHCQQVTSDGLNTLSSQMTLLTNPTVGDLLVWYNETFPQNGKVTTADSLGNVATGKVTQTAPHTITFSSGIPFSMAGCSSSSGSSCDWNGKTIVVNGSSLTINAVSSFTSLTVTNTISTNATPVAYTGPGPSCTDVEPLQAISLSACMAFVQNTGTDVVTVTTTGVSNFDVGTVSIELAYNGGVVTGLDTGACTNANCLASTTTSNGTTGVFSQTMTLGGVGELVMTAGDGVNGPIGPGSGFSGLVIGSTSGTLSNPYCTGSSPFCLNGVNSAAKSSASSGSFTASLIDASLGDDVVIESLAFTGASTTSPYMPPVVY